ncbi:MAG: FHA domain-containing protein [Myxococcaceae bacterium]
MKKHEEAIPTSIYNTEKQDEELPQSYDPAMVDDGHKPSFLYVERGPGAGQLVQIKQGPLVCGRASVSDLRLQHSSISRRHAQLTRAGERFYIKDLGSQNGTFINKIKIATEIEIYPGDQIALGNALIKLRGPLQQAQAPASAKGELKVKQSQSKILTSTRAKRPGVSVAKVALFAGAVGFGLAGVLMFTLLNVPSGGPSFQSLPGARPEADKAPARDTPGRAVAAPVSDEDKAKVVDARLREAMQEQKAAKEAPRADEAVEPARGAAAVAAHGKKAKHAVASRTPGGKAAASEEESEDQDEEEAPAAASSPKRSSILASYEKGDAAASLEAAKRAGDKDLVAKLSKFQSEYEAAGAAIAAKNGTSAIKHFDAALKLDEQLSSGWGKYGTEIRRQLSGLWTLVGFAHLEAENSDAARQAFSAALRHDPENSRAKGQLDKLGSAEKPAAKKDIDDAFGEEEKPAPKAAAPKAAPKPEPKEAPAAESPSRSSAIDDAFGD